MARSTLLLEFQHQRRRQRPVGVHELQDLREQLRVVQRGRGDIAEQADVAVLELEPAHHLHAAEQQHVVDPRHQPAGLGRVEEFGRLQHGAVLGPQPGERLVVADLALRQRHDRLQIEIDAVGLDRGADDLDHLVAGGLGIGGWRPAWSALRRAGFVALLRRPRAGGGAALRLAVGG